ncbi:uncharacterized protein [Bemisia tabaci]|uniref:uncharacterized protein n=1 Tax=Bemisia tabaci TaxID=7038 RepID=UPI003B28071D
MNPLPPKLQGYLKIHKVTEELSIRDVPIRPVVSTCQSPTYDVEKFLIKTFRRHVTWKPQYAVKNSGELAEKLENIEIPLNAKLISLDVDNLYTNVDVEETNMRMKTILKDHSSLSKGEIMEFTTLLEFTTSNNYFKYNGKFYKMNKGLPMGGPISPIMADIFMDKYDHRICTSNKWASKILCYFRYMDDIFAVWLGTDRELSIFHNEINDLHPNLRFKLEVGGKTLNFLDLTIRVENRKIKFGIYRKQCFTDAIIPNNSYHPWPQKMAGFHSMLNRLTTIPLEKEEYERELTTILNIATNNGYQKRDIFHLLHRKQQEKRDRMIYGKIKTKGTEKWISIPYIEKISERVKGIIEKDKSVKVTYGNQRNLGRILINTKEKCGKLEASGVYKIECNCGKIYIGQTGRSVATRLKEHVDCAILKRRGQSSFGDHIIDTDHKLENCYAKLEKVCQKGRKLNVLEQIEIMKTPKEQLLNSQIEQQVAPVIVPPRSPS